VRAATCRLVRSSMSPSRPMMMLSGDSLMWAEMGGSTEREKRSISSRTVTGRGSSGVAMPWLTTERWSRWTTIIVTTVMRSCSSMCLNRRGMAFFPFACDRIEMKGCGVVALTAISKRFTRCPWEVTYVGLIGSMIFVFTHSCLCRESILERHSIWACIASGGLFS